jgi:AraC-like DNA-binding protein
VSPQRQSDGREAAPHEWSSFAADPGRGVEVLHARFTTYAYDSHSHDDYVFGLIEDGLQTFRYRRADHWGRPGAVFALNPSELHDGRPGAASGFTYRAIHIAPEAIRRILEDICDRPVRLPFFAEAMLRDPALPPLMRDLHAAFAAGASGIERDVALMKLVAAIVIGHAEARPLPAIRRPSLAALDRVRATIEANPALDHSADALAALAGTSRFCLLRAFQRVYGLSPHAYLRQRRLHEARRLLAAGEAPAAAAAAAGFADQSHLTKRFKGAFGLTPSRYRAAIIGAR